MYVVALKVLITVAAAIAVGGGVSLFLIAKQDGSKAGQFLGVAIPVIAIISAFYFTF